MNNPNIKKYQRKRKKRGPRKFFSILLLIILVLAVTDFITMGLKGTSYIVDGYTSISNKIKLEKILKNKDQYPETLVELAKKNSETIDFVYNYISKSSMEEEKNTSKSEYPLYIQWDKRWGYDMYGDEFIALNGCGPTALAMVISGLTGDVSVTPKTVAEFSYENDYYVDEIGSSWDLMTSGAASFGLKSEELPLDEGIVIETLKSGKPIIVTMGPGEFTSSGHFILLTGVDEDNKIIINDSDSKKRSNKKWDIDVFMREAQNLWSFSL